MNLYPRVPLSVSGSAPFMRLSSRQYLSPLHVYASWQVRLQPSACLSLLRRMSLSPDCAACSQLTYWAVVRKVCLAILEARIADPSVCQRPQGQGYKLTGLFQKLRGFIFTNKKANHWGAAGNVHNVKTWKSSMLANDLMLTLRPLFAVRGVHAATPTGA